MPHLPQATPEELGLDPRRLQTAYDILQEWTQRPGATIPGGAILVGRRGKVLPARYFGRQGPEADAAPIHPQGIFLLASITKPIVYLAGMMMVERGKLGLTEPVASYLPDFAAHHKEEIRVHHLFTHTSGLPDMLDANTELRRRHAPLEEFTRGAMRDTVPLFPAGTQFHYQSLGTLLVAELVQRLSGLTIHEFLKREIFLPLGLADTSLGSGNLDPARLVRVQVPDYQGNDASDYGWNSDYWRALGSPWGGMFSTPEDFAVLCQLMLHGGELGGTRLLSPASVTAMTGNRLEDYPDLPEPLRRCRPWGLGWALNHPGQHDTWGDTLPRTAFGHIGATGTMAWMDREREGFALIFTTALRERAPWRLVRLSNAVASAFV